MFPRRILLSVISAAALFSQEPTSPPTETAQPKESITPFKPRFVLPPNGRWSTKFLQDKTLQDKTRTGTKIENPKPEAAKTCSIPLTNVTPRVKTYMPAFKPKIVDEAMVIPPPAPACKEDR